MTIDPQLLSTFSNLTLSSPIQSGNYKKPDDKKDFEKLISLGVIDQTGQVQPDYQHKRPCQVYTSSLVNLTQFLNLAVGQVSLRDLIKSTLTSIKAHNQNLVDLLFGGEELYKLLGHEFVIEGLTNLACATQPLDLLSHESISHFYNECKAPIKTLSIRFVLPSAFQGDDRQEFVKKLWSELSALTGPGSISPLTDLNFALMTGGMTIWFVFTSAPVTDIFATNDSLKLSVPTAYINGAYNAAFRFIDSSFGAEWLLDTFFQIVRIPNLHLPHHFPKIIRSLLLGNTLSQDLAKAIAADLELVALWREMCQNQVNPSYRDDHLQSILLISEILVDPESFIAETLSIYEQFFGPVAGDGTFFTISCRLIRDGKCSFDEWQAITALFLLIQPSYGQFTHKNGKQTLEMSVGTNRYFIPFDLKKIIHFSKTSLPKLFHDADFDQFVACFSHPQPDPGYSFALPDNFERDFEASLPVNYLILLALNPASPLVSIYFAKASASYPASLKSLLFSKNSGLHPTSPESIDLQWIKLLLQLPNQVQKLEGVRLLVALKGHIDEKKALMPQVISISQSHAEKLFLEVNPTSDEMRVWLKSCDMSRAIHRLVNTIWMPLCVETDLEAALQAVPNLKEGREELSAQIMRTCDEACLERCVELFSLVEYPTLFMMLRERNAPHLMVKAVMKSGRSQLDENIFLNLLWATSTLNALTEDTARWFLSILPHNKARPEPALQMQLFIKLCQLFPGLINNGLKSYVADLHANLSPDEQTILAPAITALHSQNDLFSALFYMYTVDPDEKCKSLIHKNNYIEAAKLLLQSKGSKSLAERVIDGLLKIRSDDNGTLIFKLLSEYYPSDVKIWGKVFTHLDENLKTNTLQLVVEHFFDRAMTNTADINENRLFYKLITTKILSNPQWLPLNSYKAVRWIEALFSSSELSGEPMQKKLLVIAEQLIKKLEQDPKKRPMFTEYAHIWYHLLTPKNVDLGFRLFALIDENCSRDSFQQISALVLPLLPHLRQQVKSKPIKTKSVAPPFLLRICKTSLSTYFKAAMRYDAPCYPYDQIYPNTYHLVNALLDFKNESFSLFLLSELVDHPDILICEMFMEFIDLINKTPNAAPDQIDAVCRMLTKLLTHATLPTCQLLYQMFFSHPHKRPQFCTQHDHIYQLLIRAQSLATEFRAHLPIFALFAKHYAGMIEKCMQSTTGAAAKIALEIDLSISIYAPESIERLMHVDLPDSKKMRLMLFLKALELNEWSDDMMELCVAMLRTDVLAITVTKQPEITIFSFHAPIYRSNTCRSYKYDNAFVDRLLKSELPEPEIFDLLGRYPSTLGIAKKIFPEDAKSSAFTDSYLGLIHTLIWCSYEYAKTCSSPVVILDFAAQLLRNKIEQNPQHDTVIKELDAHIYCIQNGSRDFECHRRISLNLLRLALHHAAIDPANPKLSEWFNYLMCDIEVFNRQDLSLLAQALTSPLTSPDRPQLEIFRLQNTLLTWQESNFRDEFNERYEMLQLIFTLWKRHPECVLERAVTEHMLTIFIPNTTLFGVKGPHREAAWRANQLFFDSCFEIYETATDPRIQLVLLYTLCFHFKSSKDCEGFYHNNDQFIAITARLIPIFTTQRALPLESLKRSLNVVLETLGSTLYEQSGVDRIAQFDLLMNRLIETGEQQDKQWIIETAIKWILDDGGILSQCTESNESNIVSFARIINLCEKDRAENIQKFFERLGKFSFLSSEAAIDNLLAQLPKSFKAKGEPILDISISIW